MPGQTVRHSSYVHLTEWTLLLFGALSTLTKVSLAVLVVERFAALVGTIELTHVEHVAHLTRDLHLLELLLAHGAGGVPREPGIEAAAADESLALAAGREVF